MLTIYSNANVERVQTFQIILSSDLLGAPGRWSLKVHQVSPVLMHSSPPTWCSKEVRANTVTSIRHDDLFNP